MPNETIETEAPGKVSCEIEYRYICDHCSHLTKWYKSTLKGFSTQQDASEAQQLEQLEASMAVVKNVFDKSANVQIDDADTFKKFKRLFPRGKSCPKCKSQQPWYLTTSFNDWKQANINNNLEITLGEPVPQHDLKHGQDEPFAEPPEAVEYFAQPPMVYTTRNIHKTNVPIEKLGYWHLSKIRHDNIILVKDVTEPEPGVFTIVEEQFEGIPLSDVLAQGVSEKEFQDLIMQLCDALIFLHNLEPSISHNAISPENILVGEDKLLKLTHFDDATLTSSPLNDMIALGILMRGVEAGYIKKYQDIIDSCIAGEYKTFGEFRKKFPPPARLPKILFAVMMILFIYRVISRRLMW